MTVREQSNIFIQSLTVINMRTEVKYDQPVTTLYSTFFKFSLMNFDNKEMFYDISNMMTYIHIYIKFI